MNLLNLQDRGQLEQFFRHTLQIEDITSTDAVSELRAISEYCKKDAAYSPKLACLSEIYHLLDSLRKQMDATSSLALK